MSEIVPVQTHSSTAKHATQVEEDVYENAQGSSRAVDAEEVIAQGLAGRRPKPKQTYSHTHFKVYKRRWLGLGQLVLLNIVVSWDVSVISILLNQTEADEMVVAHFRTRIHICSNLLSRV